MRNNVTQVRNAKAHNQPPLTSDPQTLASLFAQHASSHIDDSCTSARAEDRSPDQECITADELALWMGVNRKTIYEYAARNVIPCRRLGRRLVFSLPAIRAWLARSAGSDPAPSPPPPVSSRGR